MDSHKKHTILVTGSTSFIAKYLIEEILNSTNYKIVATYRSSIGDYKQNNRLTFEKVDLLYPDSFEEIFKKHKPKYMVHLAAMARVSDGEKYPLLSFRANFIATVKLVDLCSKYRVTSSLIVSSNLAQNAVSTVGISKLLVEQYAQKNVNTTSNIVCYRVPNVIDSKGAVTNVFRKQITEGKPITITHPDMSRLFITGPKAASEIIYLMKKGVNKGVYVSYKEPVKIIDLAKQMIKESGKKIPIKIIGMKPGEKLTEHSFNREDLLETDIQYLGMIRDYSYSTEIVDQAIVTLNNKEEIQSNTETQEILNTLF